jgi:hypothetical protein
MLAVTDTLHSSRYRLEVYNDEPVVDSNQLLRGRRSFVMRSCCLLFIGSNQAAILHSRTCLTDWQRKSSQSLNTMRSVIQDERPVK